MLHYFILCDVMLCYVMLCYVRMYACMYACMYVGRYVCTYVCISADAWRSTQEHGDPDPAGRCGSARQGPETFTSIRILVSLSSLLLSLLLLVVLGLLVISSSSS